MRQIYRRSQKVEISERTFWELLKAVVEIFADTIAGTLYGGISGFPHDLGDNTILDWIKTNREDLYSILPEITDHELTELLKSLNQEIQEMYSLNHLLINAIAAQFNLSAPQTKQDYKKLRQKMNRDTGPVLHDNSGFRQVVRQMRQTYLAIQRIKKQIDQKISEQLSLLEEGSLEAGRIYNILEEVEVQSDLSQTKVEIDLSDEALDRLAEELIDEPELTNFQLVKDLIDMGNEDFDPRQAIQIFHLALRYQPGNTYASAAYMGIGMRYEALEDREKAIENFTKAIELDKHNARLFFWRGELYYELGEQAKAKSDLERAVTIWSGHPAYAGLFRDERETVEKYLAELNKPEES